MCKFWRCALSRLVASLLPFCVLLLRLDPAAASPKDSVVAQFTEAYCVSCHGAADPKGTLNLDGLATAFDDPAKAAVWVRVYDKVVNGEMPPKRQSQPEPDERTKFTDHLRDKLHAASLKRQQTDGRVVVRRLNRIEYENTLRDLLGTQVHVRDVLPEDGASAGFDTVSAGLETSPTHLVRHQQAVDKSLAAAVTTAPANEVREKFTGKEWVDREAKANRKALLRATAVEGDTAVLYHQTVQHHELNVLHGTSLYGRTGQYRIRLTAQARNTGGRPLPLKFTWEWKPGNTQLTHIVAIRDVPADKPATIEVVFDMQHAGGEYRVGAAAYTLPLLPDEKAPQPDRKIAPGLVVFDYEIEGPVSGWPSPGHKTMFDDLPLEPRSFAEARATSKPIPTDDWKKWPAREFVKNPLVPVSADPKADADRLIRAFVPRAFRRPVTPAEIDYFVKFAHDRLARGVPFGEAVLAAYKAVLCSPHVLFLPAKPGLLDDHALAARLSYFLWSSTPDDELLAVAAKGELRRPAVLRAQVERMLDSPKIERFIENFTGQWLDLRKVLTMKPDEHYAEYDDALGWSMPFETTRFFTEMLTADRGVTEFVHSDWTFVNERLAKHYGIPDVFGMAFRKVALKPEYHRGGVMTHAAVLKSTANGSYTSPVRRGVWVLERIIGQPPDPPPPDVPAIEPDIRGAKTLRMQLEKHRALPTCAGCHAKIDPPGFALESFDVIGGWRTEYRTVGSGTLRRIPNYPELKSGYFAAPVETASITASGDQFKDVEEYKSLLLKDPDQIARTVARKLLVYGTGADIQFADRRDVEEIVAAARKKKHGLRTLVHEVVQSRVFLTK